MASKIPNKSGGKQKRPRSAAQKAAHRTPRARGLPKAKVTIADTARTTFGRLRKGADADAGVEAPRPKLITKGQYEKIPGTRIQISKRGVPVRVVVESGKEFPPEKVWSARQHLAKLEGKRAVAAEVARIRGDAAGPAEGAAKPAKPAPKGTKRKAGSKQAVPSQVSKKERKVIDRAERLRKLSELQKATMAGSERELLGEHRHLGEVLQRCKGFAWVALNLADSTSLPPPALQQLQGAGAAAGGDAEGRPGSVRVWFFDVADPALNLQPGVKVSLRLYADKDGLGAWDVKSAARVEADAGGEGAVQTPEEQQLSATAGASAPDEPMAAPGGEAGPVAAGAAEAEGTAPPPNSAAAAVPAPAADAGEAAGAVPPPSSAAALVAVLAADAAEAEGTAPPLSSAAAPVAVPVAEAAEAAEARDGAER